ncbi:transporter substrate-binding domain-containing protein [Pseudomonas sp. TMP25]|uniref:substrate-binding periplasmic protein n=1 Tax=Pseudomonas sp. TMP25 TaxID=3136561 RepID=UPI0031011FE1
MIRLLASIALLFVTGAGHAQSLKVCTNEWPPYTLLEEGQVRGIDADLLYLVLTNLGIRYDITLEPWRRCLRKMSDGKLDILLDAFYSDERAKTMIFPSEPMAESSMVLFHARARPYMINSVDDLTGLRVGTEPGYAYSLEAFAKGTHFIREDAPTLDANVGKLLLGRVDLVITDRAVGLFTARNMGVQHDIAYSPQPLYSDRVYAAFSRRPAVAALVPSFESELRRVKQTQEYAAILRRYHQKVSIQAAEQTDARAD